jgi:hypothetical protein
MADRRFKPRPPARKVDPCGAETRSEDKHPCRLPPINGSKRCRFHGGASPSVKAKAERDRVEGELRELAATLAAPPVDNPLEALSALAGEIKAWKDFLAEKLTELNTLRYSGEHAEQIRGEVVLYERALDRAVSVLTSIARLNIDERLAAIGEVQAAMLEGALEAALTALGLSVEDKTRAWDAAASHLRLAG